MWGSNMEPRRVLYTLTIVLLAGMGLIVAALSGCGAQPQKPAAAAPPEVTVSQVVSRSVTDYADFTGRAEPVESVEVRARVSGYLTRVDFTDGQEVKQGEVLFQIDPRPFQASLAAAEGQKAQAQAKMVRAQTDLKRYEQLAPTGAITPQDLDKATADARESTAAVQSAEAAIDRANLDLEFATIAAPIGGQISRAMATKGNLVRGDSELLTTIVSLNPIYIYFDVSERDLLQALERARAVQPAGTVVQNIRSLKIPVYAGLANEQGYPHKGVIDFADNRVNPATGTIRVRGTFDNSNRIFKPGLFARVRLPSGGPYETPLVAERAIGIDQGMKYVLTVNDQNVVKQQFVKLGPLQDNGLRVVKAGVNPGEWIVVNGLQRARPGKTVAPQRAEMPTRADEVATTVGVTPPAASTGQTGASLNH